MSAVIKKIKFQYEGISLKASHESSPPRNEVPEYRYNENGLDLLMKFQKKISVGDRDYYNCWTFYINEKYVDHDWNRNDLAERQGLKLVYPDPVLHKK